MQLKTLEDKTLGHMSIQSKFQLSRASGHSWKVPKECGKVLRKLTGSLTEANHNTNSCFRQNKGYICGEFSSQAASIFVEIFQPSSYNFCGNFATEQQKRE